VGKGDILFLTEVHTASYPMSGKGSFPEGKATGAIADHKLTSTAKSSEISWDIMPCGPVEASLSFGITYHLHLLLLPCFMLVSCVSYYSTLKMEATLKYQLTFNTLLGVKSHNIKAFTTMRTSDTPGRKVNVLGSYSVSYSKQKIVCIPVYVSYPKRFLK
jgi:hypothetical protein